MTDRLPVSHTEHDPLLVAAFAAGDLGDPDRQRAELLALSCPDCALLAADLRAIATATAALPPRPRPRDFSLGAADAARLRRRSWRGLVRAFAGPRSGALRPLATSLTTLGIAGLLLATLPTLQLLGSAAGPSGGNSAARASGDIPKAMDTADGAAPSVDPGREYSVQSGGPRLPVPAGGPVASPLTYDRAIAGQSHSPDRVPLARPEPAASAGPAASPLVLLSGTLLILGLALFGLRWTAGRLSDR
jgi:hypothetical protein